MFFFMVSVTKVSEVYRFILLSYTRYIAQWNEIINQSFPVDSTYIGLSGHFDENIKRVNGSAYYLDLKN